MLIIVKCLFLNCLENNKIISTLYVIYNIIKEYVSKNKIMNTQKELKLYMYLQIYCNLKKSNIKENLFNAHITIKLSYNNT